MDEVPKNVEESVGLQDLPPQIVCSITFRILRSVIACAALSSALVKRQKNRLLPLKTRAHINLVLADSKMHQSATFEAEQGLGLSSAGIGGQASGFILLNRLLNRLFEL